MVCRQLGNEYPDVTYVECNLKAPFTKAYCCRSRSSNSLHTTIDFSNLLKTTVSIICFNNCLNRK